jgi:hypothetical protein
MYTDYVTAHCRVIPLLFAFPFLHSLLLPIRLSLLTWNPPCCDRICPPCSQVARKLIFPFPSPCSYTPHSKIPAPLGFPRSKYTFIRTTSRTWLTRSSTVTVSVLSPGPGNFLFRPCPPPPGVLYAGPCTTP